ncbi:PIR protein [Plasmodium ovale]|uniref:PIR protein n=1 Tax=Plasmodium ovale TaxID=36330 RepID=A0A1D3JE66_PLAOA|nr:PIR protein [Plasmodium ovale]
MPNCNEDISSSEILKCNFFNDSKFESIHEEISKICDDNFDNQKSCTEPQDNLECCSIVADKMKELKRKFNDILQSYQVEKNYISSYRNVEDVKKQCLCLKNSFYNKVINVVKKKTNFYELLKRYNCDIMDKTNDFPSTLCIFRNLNIREMERIKTIYDFYLYYYSNIKDLTVGQKLDKPPNGFKKGFYEHCNSIIECLHDTSKSEYCEEFKEYNNKYNAFRIFLKSLISYPEKIDGSDCDNGCVLAESLLKGQYLLELKEEIKKIRSGYRSTNSQTTAITVVSLVIGTINPSELWSRIRKQKNKETHASLDDETESSSLFTSENIENNSKRKGYSISYKSVKYS